MWRTGDGTRVRFWKDRWLKIGILEDLILNLDPTIINDFSVAQVINEDGDWSYDILEALLPQEILEHIRSTPRPLVANLSDEIFWAATPDGRFSVKSAYELISSNEIEPTSGNWDWIWKIPSLERIRTFV